MVVTLPVNDAPLAVDHPQVARLPLVPAVQAPIARDARAAPVRIELAAPLPVAPVDLPPVAQTVLARTELAAPLPVAPVDLPPVAQTVLARIELAAPLRAAPVDLPPVAQTVLARTELAAPLPVAPAVRRLGPVRVPSHLLVPLLLLEPMIHRPVTRSVLAERTATAAPVAATPALQPPVPRVLFPLPESTRRGQTLMSQN